MNGNAAARLGKLGSTALSVLAVLALSFVISWPLWSFAIGDRRAFTLSVGLGLTLGFLSFVGISLRKRIRSRSGPRRLQGGRRPGAQHAPL
jgi:hypothetical protein